MKKSRAPAFDIAALPEELHCLGQPVAVHRPWKAVIEDARVRLLTRLFGEQAADFGRDAERMAAFVLAAATMLGGVCFVWAYFYRPPQNEDPRFLLILAGVMFVFTVALIGVGVFRRRPGNREDDFSGDPGTLAGDSKQPGKPDLYLVYADGLAAVEEDGYEFFAWDEVRELASVWVGMDRQLKVVDQDDRQLVIQNGYTDMGELRQAIYQRVNDVMLPLALEQIADGKSVEFGPYTLRNTGLRYKDRKAKWKDVTSMKITNYRGDVRLTIYTKGRMLAWCWCDVHTVPNWNTFYDALCRTAPAHLLVTSNRPRW